MWVECRLPVVPNLASSDPAPVPISLTADGTKAELSFQVEGGRLTVITLIIPGQPVDADGKITEQTEALAYRSCAHIVNHVYLQTGLDAVRLDNVFRGRLKLKPYPESADEEETLKRMVSIELRMPFSVDPRPFDLATFPTELGCNTPARAVFCR